jgi:hypothetical protein
MHLMAIYFMGIHLIGVRLLWCGPGMGMSLALSTTFSRLSTIQFFTLAVTASCICLIDVHVMDMYLMGLYLIGVCLMDVYVMEMYCSRIDSTPSQYLTGIHFMRMHVSAEKQP